jgi:osmotically-inducible protein OsmY
MEVDKDLRQSILEELDFDPSFDAANIGVAVEKGVVTLTATFGAMPRSSPWSALYSA